jgi:hypothetical protein
MKVLYNDDEGLKILIPAIEIPIGIIADKDVPAPRVLYDVPTGQFETVIIEETGEEYESEIMNPRTVIYYYKIVEDSEIPQDRATRSEWNYEITEANADGRGLTKQEFEAKYPDLIGWAVKE